MKAFLFFILGGIGGVIAGAGGMLIAFPYLFPPPAVNETVDIMAAGQVLAESEFRQGVSGQDGAHWGKGSLKVYQAKNDENIVLVELQPNFQVGAGPNFWLYLNSVSDIDDEDDFEEDENRIKLTKLKSFTGSQVYQVSGKDYNQAKSLTIWCESFGQYIASANLVTDG